MYVGGDRKKLEEEIGGERASMRRWWRWWWWKSPKGQGSKGPRYLYVIQIQA